MTLGFEEKELAIEQLSHPLFEEKKVRVRMARLDTLHPVVSGNKLFKLHYFLKEALLSPHKQVITFGGAYSNHLAATAYAASELGLKATGIVRGERPIKESHTLETCRGYGMQLHFISRDAYRHSGEESFLQQLQAQYGESTIIPEGGYHPLGAAGAALIMQKVPADKATHICVAVGTATTLAGLLSGASGNQLVTGFPVLKGMTDILPRLHFLTGPAHLKKLKIVDGYHFGGYAKYTGELTGFMNDFFSMQQVPLDIVYTAKMMFGVYAQIKKDYFAEGSDILCLHTGGLQGNQSLPTGTLIY
jgi:1-aminocyclopropane-1-carboxylate deaminase/D-cysteine desulfhydrase-like pyridoxal-dependent ACC family enzyme